MSSDAPESAQHSVSDLLYIDIFLVCAQIMACDTECREFDRNPLEAVVSDCYRFIVASCVWQHVLRCFFSALCGVLIIALLRGNTEYVLMGFKFLVSTIYSNTGSSY